jgi:NitT/TauT family transport system ATP-binding protein
MALLELREIEFSYANGLTALRNVSLRAEAGEFVCIVGPSGCGKSTLLDLIDGLARVNRGEILIGGRPVERPGPDRAVVFQAASLLPWRSVVGNIAFALESTRRPELRAETRVQRRERVASLVRLVGLEGFESYYPGALSGGMRQRVNLARALAVEPDILLMDEPFANLDAQTRDMMQVELLRIWSRSKRTVVFVTHSIQEAVFLGDRVVVMSGRPGSIIRDIKIDIARPRSADGRRGDEYTKFEEEIGREMAGFVKMVA